MNYSNNGGLDMLIQNLAEAQLFLLRWENAYVPEAGITAVTKKEREYFKSSIIVSPYFPFITEKNDRDKVIASTGITLEGNGVMGEVLITTDQSKVPIVFLKLEEYFTARMSPYYTKEVGITSEEARANLERDVLVFGCLFEIFLKKLIKMGISLKEKGVNGADWQFVPALIMAKPLVKNISHTIHNTYTAWLHNEAKNFPVYNGTPISTRDDSALRIIFDHVDAITTVSTGYAHDLANEFVHKYVLDPDICLSQAVIKGVNNGFFSSLGTNERDLLLAYRKDSSTGIKALKEYNENAKEQFLKKANELLIDVEGKVIFIINGRTVTQKLIELSVMGIRKYLEGNKDKAVFIITLLPGTDDSERVKLLQELALQFPKNVLFCYGACEYFMEALKLANFVIFNSLYEPFGGCYTGTATIPLVFAIDGLVSQVSDPQAKGEALRRHRQFHSPSEKATGILVYPEIPVSIRENHELMLSQYREINEQVITWQSNDVFNAMTEALVAGIVRAVDLRTNNFEKFAEIVFNILEKQEDNSLGWINNYETLKDIHGIS